MTLKSKLTRIYQEKIFRNAYFNTIKKELYNCDEVLDLGCGRNSAIQYCTIHFSVGVEIFEPDLEESKKKRLHNQYIKADITKIEFKPESFDAVVALNVLEHLSIEEGVILIEKMKKWTRKKIVISTPNGYVFQDEYDNNPQQKHKSGWSVEQLEKTGFKSVGCSGWKQLKGYKGTIKYKPRLFWIIISDMSQKIVYNFPKLAFEIIGIWKKNND
ncbi:MAG: class I SAM-dependent methyltransferase [Candidatus Methanoperedens sp.]|nr:class I SAM-dependent methyltransferase [Candidatus Methanoperedens sp.]